jgi:predicted MPP superfamily phosphohydrolase
MSMEQERSMTSVAWATDIHLDWVEEAVRLNFYRAVRESAADAVVLSGDIAEGANTLLYLDEMARQFRRPIYFVLGNHDFYGDSLARTRRRVVELTTDRPFLHYLSASGVVELTPQTALIGQEGWGDARLGDFEHSRVFLTDFVAIEELAQVHRDRPAFRKLLEELGDQAARSVAADLSAALDRYPRVVLVTHVPPFREAAWYEGRLSNDDWLPYFTCSAVGDVLRQAMQQHPQRQLLVLCGHTHGRGEARLLPNLRVLTGGAEGTGPIVQQVLRFA